MDILSEEKVVREKLNNVVDGSFFAWLNGIGYFKAPAAKSHHGNYPGGLFDHSYKVAEILDKYTKELGLEWLRPESPWIVGLLHDICKTDDYVSLGNEDGKEIYDINKKKICDGHGDKSVIMLAGRIKLTDEEVACIQFHMGAFVDKEQWKYYSQAVRNYPNVLYTHTADMYASQVLGV